MTTERVEPLKDCPFCGKEADYDEDIDHISCCNTEGACGFFFNGEGYSKDELIKMWNTRPAPELVPLSDEDILIIALESGFMISTKYGQDSNKPMPVSDRTTLLKFSRAITDAINRREMGKG